MLPPFIIEQIRQREERDRQRRENISQPRLELPVAPLPVAPLGAEGLAHCRAAHRSAEAAHGALLAELGLRPLLDLELRLGEGSGAALAVMLARAGLACHQGMASFADAGVDAAC